MSLLAKLKAGNRNSKIVNFPESAQTVALRILTCAESQDATLATERRFKASGIVVGTTTLQAFTEEETIQHLARALRDPENLNEPFAKSVDELRANLTEAEREFLAGEYLAFESEYSPKVNEMSDAEFSKLIEDVKKNPTLIGNISSTDLLKRLTTFLVSPPPISPMDSGHTS